MRYDRRHVHQVGGDQDLQPDAAPGARPGHRDRLKQHHHQPVLHQRPRGREHRRHVHHRRGPGTRHRHQVRRRYGHEVFIVIITNCLGLSFNR